MKMINKKIPNGHNNNMKIKNRLNGTIILCLGIFFVISILALYSFSTYLTQNLVLKQIVFYLASAILVFIIYKIGIERIAKYSFYIYLVNVLLLFLVLIFGKSINGTKAWFDIPIIGGFQPSEFMKIGIILLLADILSKKEIRSTKEEIIELLLAFIIILIPSILTFLEPDTGAIFTYLVACFLLLFLSGITLRWFVLFFFIVLALLGGILYLYYFQKELFINVLGSSFFYRLDRLFDWSNSQGMQLENSIINIASSGIFGHGFNNIKLYYPEGHTDFIFTSFISCFGLVGAVVLITTIITFDLAIIKVGEKNKEKRNKLIIAGVIGVLIYQQLQNIAMTIGLLPITGVTLPFISYGGSSLLSYMILIGLVLSINKQEKKSFKKKSLIKKKKSLRL